MNTPTTRPHLRPQRSEPELPRHRTESPAPWPAVSPWRPVRAVHDLLVPNPRPDLTTDLRTLRMIEAG